LVLALYIDSTMVREQYNHPEIILLICPLVLYWINKLWLHCPPGNQGGPCCLGIKERISRVITVLSVAAPLAKWLP
jgi:hypothetical protein